MTTSAVESGAVMVTGRRWAYAVIGMVMLLFLGLVYAWSIFVPPLEQEFGWSRSETSMAFSICMSMFCIGGLVTGFITRKKPARFAVALCAIFICVGFALASRCSSLVGLYISYGGFVGLGVGMGYNGIISTLLKWFPDKMGFVSGLMLMGFGCGALLLGTVGSLLLAELGWRTTFLILGIFYAVLILGLSFFIVPPPGNLNFPKPIGSKKKAAESAGEVPTGQMIRRPSFIMYFSWTVVLTAGGLMLIGHATPLAMGLGSSAATAAFLAGMISVFNGLGRVIGGIGFDLLGRKTLMRLISLGFIMCAVLVYLCLQTGSAAILTLTFVLVGLFYGCVMPMNATVISTFYGLKHYSMNFSVITLNIIFASFIGPYLAGVLHTMSGSYAAMSVAILIFGVVALALSFMIRRP